jgi:maltose alpha-D-glucosyltransferase / alpha-amylase
VRRISAEQSNSSIIYGDSLILKLFRRVQAGPNPDVEIGRYLTEKAHFDRIPAFMGSFEYRTASRRTVGHGDAAEADRQ